MFMCCRVGQGIDFDFLQKRHDELKLKKKNSGTTNLISRRYYSLTLDWQPYEYKYIKINICMLRLFLKERIELIIFKCWLLLIALK